MRTEFAEHLNAVSRRQKLPVSRTCGCHRSAPCLTSSTVEMGRRAFKPAQVYETAKELLEVKSKKSIRPNWYNTAWSIPPSEIITRTQPVQHRNALVKGRTKKLSKMFQPQAMVYEEDEMRTIFYRDHPWELARPRIVLEQDGKDGQRCDWSRIQQPGRQLDGESVVQRQLWLLQNGPGMTSTNAYDQARREFYAIRHEEDIERRVAREEALSTGAYFGKSMLEIGMELEDKLYESWKGWATKEIATMEQQKNSAYTGFGPVEEEKASDSTLGADANELRQVGA